MNQKLTDLAKQFIALKAEYEAQEEKLGEIAKRWTELDLVLTDAFIAEGAKSVEIEGHGLVGISTTNFLSVTAENDEIFFEYLRRNGKDGLIKAYVHPKTKTSTLKIELANLTRSLESQGMDSVDARETALKQLQADSGAAYFTKRQIKVYKR